MYESNSLTSKKLDYSKDILSPEQEARFAELGGIGSYLNYTPDVEGYAEYRQLYLIASKAKMSAQRKLRTTINMIV